jgi:HEAT repeat protein
LNIKELPDSGLITLVQGDDPASRTRAIHLLGQRKATGAVLPLIEAMEDETLRPAITGALALMKAEATPVLIRLLGSPDPLHRKHAAFMSGEFRSAAVMKSLIPLLGDLSREVRTAASEALGKIGEGALGDLRGAIRNPDPNVRTGIVNALGTMAAPGPSGREKPGSLEDLPGDEGVPGGPDDGFGGEGGSGPADRDDGKRPAENGHPALSPENREAVVSLLMQLLDDENPHVRDAASAALHRVGGPSADPVPEGIDSSDPKARKDAIRALGQSIIFRETGAAIPPLIEALFDEDPEIRFLAAKSLRYAKDPRAVTPLNACLLDVSPDVRQEAVEGLRRRKDPRTLEPLVHALRDESPGVRRAAACALGESGYQGVRDALMHCRHDGDHRVRDAAARSLGMLGPDPRLDPHILVRSPDPEKRSGAIAQLGTGKDENDLSLITGALGDEDAGVRRAAAEALCGFSDPAAIPPLLGALSDTKGDVRMYALRALQGILDSRVLVPLIYALKDSHAPVRTEAVSHLRKIGDDEAVPYLIEALGDPDDGVCREAVLLLGNIGGERTEATLRDLELKTHDPLKLAAVRTALDQISRMNKAGAGTRGEPSGGGTADRVVISMKKNVEPASPHPLVVTPRKETETPAGDFSECLALWEKDPPAARVWQHLLDTAGDYLEKEEFIAAKPLLEKAWDLCPDSELLVTRLGLTLASLGRYEEALSIYKNGIAINPRNDALWSNAGALLANLERYDEALRSYKQALALCMSDEKVWYQTGIVLNNLGRYAEAVKCFDRALLLNPAFPEAVEARRIARGNVGR